MPQDVLIEGNEYGVYDLALNDAGTDFASAEGFETALPVSLFTDARAPASTVAEPLARRGWIGDLLTLDQNRELGGLLWTYDQSKLTRATFNGIQDETEKSVSWMVEDGALKSVSVETVLIGTREIQFDFILTGFDNKVDRYSVLWRRTEAGALATL